MIYRCLKHRHTATEVRCLTSLTNREAKWFTDALHTGKLLERPCDLQVPGTQEHCQRCQVNYRFLSHRQTATEAGLFTGAMHTGTCLHHQGNLKMTCTQDHCYFGHVINNFPTHMHTLLYQRTDKHFWTAKYFLQLEEQKPRWKLHRYNSCALVKVYIQVSPTFMIYLCQYLNIYIFFTYFQSIGPLGRCFL